MKQTEMNGKVAGSRTRFVTMKTLLLTATAVLTLAFAAPAAYAGCGLQSGARDAGVKFPALAGAFEQMEMHNDSIVGLWQTSYTAGGQPFGNSFKQWHSDGTEFENVDHNPTIGNICFGVWKQIGERTVRLHHLGWLFGTDGSPEGTFTIDEIDVLAPNGMTYTGSFVFKTFNPDGTFTGVEVSGTIAASRITVN